MPNYFKRMSLQDYLDNTNVIDSQPVDESAEGPLTLNKIRAGRMTKPEPYDFGAGEIVKNIESMEPGAPRTTTKTTKPEFQFPVVKPETEAKEIPGQIPGRPMSMASANIPETPTPPKTPTQREFWNKKVIGDMPLDQFVTIAGSLAQAIAPGTAQGRVGETMARIASPVYKKRIEREIETPEAALGRRLTEAKIANLEKDTDPKTAMAWYLQSNPEATPEEVAAFKQSLDTEKAGNYWRTVSDDGTVSIYKGADLVHKSAPGIGKTKEEKLYKTEEGGLLPTSEAKGKTPFEPLPRRAPVTWTTANRSLKGRFGKESAMGSIIVTPALEKSHALAQEKLVEFKKSGDMDPLEAVNKSYRFVKGVEDKYWEYYDSGSKKLKGRDRRSYLDRLKKAFKKKYGYVPKTRME